MRYSKQREKILEIVKNSCDHPDAITICNRVKKQIPNISLGTVYRNLNSLSNNGDLKRIVMQDGNDRFDKTIDSHNHIHCKLCDKVMDISIILSKDIINNIEKETDFKITDCNFNINGICKSCEKERNL